MRVIRKDPPLQWKDEAFLPPEVYSVREITAPLGEDIEHTEYGPLHGQQGCFVLTAKDGEEIIVHPDDLAEHYTEIGDEPLAPVIEVGMPTKYFPGELP